MRGTNIFNVMGKSLVESANGKIRRLPNGWHFGNEGTTNNQGVFIKSYKTVDGKDASLTLGQLSAFNCPQSPSEEYPRMKAGYSVPMKVCRKCPNHIPRRNGQPYPCCKILKEIRSNGPSPLQKMSNIIETAKDQVNKMME